MPTYTNLIWECYINLIWAVILGLNTNVERENVVWRDYYSCGFPDPFWGHSIFPFPLDISVLTEMTDILVMAVCAYISVNADSSTTTVLLASTISFVPSDY